MSNKSKPLVVIVSPALAAANSGNWHTAYRWSRFLSGHCRTEIVTEWDTGAADAMIALHARRSAASIARFAQQRPGRPLVVVLTGTDLYRDIRTDAAAQRSLALATRLVVLQDMGPEELNVEQRAKCVVIYQSAPRLAPVRKTARHLRAVMVGHLRDEKDPLTFMRAARRLSHRGDILLDHIGNPLDPALSDAARETAAACPHYRWLGGLPRPLARRHIKQGHVLVHASRMEGGAHVILEAIQSGTPVVASRIPGNVGMLGRDYPGYFELGDDAGLALLLERCREEPAFLQQLHSQCDARAHLFDPGEERRHVLHLIASILEHLR